MPISLSPAHWFSFLAPLLAAVFGVALTESSSQHNLALVIDAQSLANFFLLSTHLLQGPKVHLLHISLSLPGATVM